MNRTALGLLTAIALAAVSVLAPLALGVTIASAGYNAPRSVLPTFHPATIQMPKPAYRPTYVPIIRPRW
jgi:hypothetical protein